MDARFDFPANILRNYFAAGAAGAAAGAAGAAGASTFGASAFGASLQPNTAIDKEAKKIILTKMANTFFIIAYPPFTDFTVIGFCTQYLNAEITLFFYLVKTNFRIYINKK
jgi:hypothetical protein